MVACWLVASLRRYNHLLLPDAGLSHSCRSSGAGAHQRTGGSGYKFHPPWKRTQVENVPTLAWERSHELWVGRVAARPATTGRKTRSKGAARAHALRCPASFAHPLWGSRRAATFRQVHFSPTFSSRVGGFFTYRPLPGRQIETPVPVTHRCMVIGARVKPRAGRWVRLPGLSPVALPALPALWGRSFPQCRAPGGRATVHREGRRR